jgi:DNA-binding response OmpR family regulator
MRILVVEDETRLARAIARVLEQERFEVDVASDGTTGLGLALTGNYDVAVVDRLLPGFDGLSLVRKLRREQVRTPILMLTALGDLPERIEGLEAGADDCLGKPFALEEMIARIRALGRRADRAVPAEMIKLGGLKINLNTSDVWVDDRLIELTPQEFRVLEVLAKNLGRIVSRDELLERAWGPDADPAGNVVELYIYYLRRKLGADATQGSLFIQTVRGAGYVLRTSS